MKDKRELRKEILAIRAGMQEKEVRERSRIICNNLRRRKEYENAEELCLYMPIKNEVDVTLLLEAAEKEGKGIWLPRVIESEMEFFRYGSGVGLVKGSFNIMEPDSDEILIPNEKTLIIMPGAVFSFKRERIGYGGGFYDRFLEKHPACMTAAVCYSFQILNEIPSEKHDIKPDIIISEE